MTDIDKCSDTADLAIDELSSGLQDVAISGVIQKQGKEEKSNLKLH